MAVPLLLSLSFLGTLCALNQNFEKEAAAENQARRVADCLSWLDTIPPHEIREGKFFSEGCMSPGGFHQDVYNRLTSGLRSNLAELASLVAGDAAASRTVEMITAKFRLLEAALDHERQLSLDRHASDLATHEAAREVRDLLLDAVNSAGETGQPIQQAQELKMAKSRSEQTYYRQLILSIVGIMTFSNVIVCLILAYLFYNHTVTRLNQLLENSRLLVSGRQPRQKLSSGDEFATIEASFRDMIAALTEMRRKEQAIADNLSAVVCTLDRQGRFVSLSRSSVPNFGRDPEQLLGTALADLMVADDRSQMPDLTNLEPGKETALIGQVNRRGELRDFRFVIRAAEVPGGTAHCVARDISEQMEDERFRKQTLALVRQRLKQPLLKMANLHQQLPADDAWSADGRKMVGVLARTTDRMLSLIEELGDAESAFDGTLSLSRQTNTVGQLCQQSVASLLALAEKKNIRIVPVLDADLVLECDGKRIVQVLVNLLSNAIKFSPHDSSIELVVQAGDDAVEFKVMDHGRGIAADMHSKLFQEFQQVESDDARVHGGSGVGLSICKSIVDLHGGHIGVESSTGSGSTFWFSIPRLNA